MSIIRTRFQTVVIVAGLAFPGLTVTFSVTPSIASPSLGEPDAFDAQTKGELQDIITKQLAALGREDATEAESFASQQLKDRFPDPARFFDMVKENYAPLIKPRSTKFEETSISPHGPLQKMTVVANDGTIWTAIYSFERVDGGWRISGCGLAKQESQDI